MMYVNLIIHQFQQNKLEWKGDRLKLTSIGADVSKMMFLAAKV
jgi:hypothetical protein